MPNIARKLGMIIGEDSGQGSDRTVGRLVLMLEKAKAEKVKIPDDVAAFIEAHDLADRIKPPKAAKAAKAAKAEATD